MISPTVEQNSGRILKVTLDEVKKHNTIDDMWMIYRSKVFNVTPYVKFHPGGPDELKKGAGKDASSLVQKYHAWVNVESMLAKCLVGVVVEPESDSDDDDSDSDGSTSK